MTARTWLLAGAAALLPSFTTQLESRPEASVAQRFHPPATPLVLTRTLWRTLADGKQIMVRRRYAVRFVSKNGGWRLDGRLLDVTVEAPAQLASLAELERRRGDEGMFPIELDERGWFRQPDNPPATSAELDEVLRRGIKQIEAAQFGAVERREVSAYLARMTSQRVLTAWPVDLFNPARGERRTHRQIALPDGEAGEIEVRIEVAASGPESRPSAIERTITTVFAGKALVSRERWTLVPEAPFTS